MNPVLMVPAGQVSTSRAERHTPIPSVMSGALSGQRRIEREAGEFGVVLAGAVVVRALLRRVSAAATR
jgi:hypothetical protein